LEAVEAKTTEDYSVFYWKLHVGDWAKSTAHLSASETGFYIRLLNWYYDREGPLPADRQAIYRIAGARSGPERRQLDGILAEYFCESCDGFRNKRADEELAQASEKSEKRRVAAQSRWNANALQVDCKGDAIQDPKTPRLQDKEISPSDLSADADANKVPATDVMAAYNSECGDLYPMATQLTDKRRRAIRKLWMADRTNQDENRRTDRLEYWQRYFEHCRHGIRFFQDAAAGKQKGDHANWRPDFDFLTRESTWIGVREGRYQ
jgi:uncharacterized protein YdaU (DUF1376 family)